jgi:apolipoprotein N-acyltransferase
MAVIFFRALFRRGQLWPAVLAFPSMIVAYEYCNSLWVGTFWNTAYTQLDDLPVLQLAAITGPWGIGFVVLLLSSTLAVILLSQGAVRRRLVITLTGIIVCVTAYGAGRLLATPSAPNSVVIGLVSTGHPAYIQPFSESPETQLNLLQKYASEAREVAARGAQIVVLPEMMALVYGPYSDRADQLFEETARGTKVQVLLDVLHATSGRTYNEARLYSPTGNLEAVYRKHHPAYALGENVTPGADIAVLDQPEGILGLAICSDMDYSDPARRYGRRNVSLLLVPAWDSHLSEAWHGHMAIMRGVENGYSIVRSSKEGLLTVSDDRGRILTETSARPDEPFTMMVTSVPVRHDRTLYDMLGDWFAWINLALFSALVTLSCVWWHRTSPQREELGSLTTALPDERTAAR